MVLSLQTLMAIYLPVQINLRYGMDHIGGVMSGLAIVGSVLAQVLCSPFYERVDRTLGRKNAIVLGYLLFIILTIMTAVLFYLPKESWQAFYSIFIMCRLCSGYAEG